MFRQTLGVVLDYITLVSHKSHRSCFGLYSHLTKVTGLLLDYISVSQKSQVLFWIYIGVSQKSHVLFWITLYQFFIKITGVVLDIHYISVSQKSQVFWITLY